MSAFSFGSFLISRLTPAVFSAAALLISLITAGVVPVGQR